MRGLQPRRTLATVGVAGAGLVLGHWLAYAIGAPHADARAQLLGETGHGYLPYATQVALLAGAVALVAMSLSRLTHRATKGAFTGDVAKLAAVQAAAFLAMEIGERLLSGALLQDLTHGPLLAIGLGVQLAIATLGAYILRLTERAAELAQVLMWPSVRPVPSLVAAGAFASSVAPRRPPMRAAASRAPPSLL
ncbi:MAG: hypothetical protein WEE66_00340 [Actinomycetota bacterium]